MSKNRLEAFSDGVIAIIITIMVLELKVPHGASFEAIRATLPTFLSYVLSYVYIGIYWNNHHHLLHTVRTVNGNIMWANLHLLFWLSVQPFVSEWMGENIGAALPAALYGGILFMGGMAFWLMVIAIQRNEGHDWEYQKVTRSKVKMPLSVVLYVTGIVLSFVYAPAAYAIYVAVAFMWVIPDRELEKNARKHE